MSGALFLNVEHSLTGRAWRARLDLAGEGLAQRLAEIGGHGDLLSRVLAGRGVALEDAARYLDPTIRDLMPEPFNLRDMETATTRLANAVEQAEHIAIFGDYDVDGACSAALLASYLEACGCKTLIHIPDRVGEGYGPNVEAVERFAAQGAKILVTVDCGAVSFEPFARARALGLDVLVFDHHQAPEILPDALAVVDPNRQDDLSALNYLCAAGVVYIGLVALNRLLRERGFWRERAAPDLLAMLDLVALASVADVVPLIGLNRAFVVKGLQVMRQRKRPGLAALYDAAGADGPPRPYHLGFILGPRINAGGRIGDSGLGVKLLMTQDPHEASALAGELHRLNSARQAIEATMLDEAAAEAQLALGQEERGAAVIVAGQGWNPGIVGLIAARLKERYQRPAFALALSGKLATGSGRSIAGVDLGRAVRAALEAGLLLKGGGHAMAAGLTIETARLGDFRAFIEAHLAAPVAKMRAQDALAIDSAVSAAGATPELVASLERAGPFGSGNPEPVFAAPGHRLADVRLVGADHLRLRLVAGDGAALEAMAFRSAQTPLGQALQSLRGARLHVAGSLSINRYGGREKVQLRVIDAAHADA